MKKTFYILFTLMIFILNVKAEVIVDYDKAVKYSQSYIYKLSKHDKYILTSTRFNEITGSTSTIPYSFSNKKLTSNNTFLSGGILTEDEFNISKDKDGYTYLVKDVEFFLMKNTSNKAVDILKGQSVEANNKKYGLRVTYFTVPEVKVKGIGSSVEPFEFVGTNKLTFYIENGKITNKNSNTNKYIVYALESNSGSIIINFEPNPGYEYLSNNCGFDYTYNSSTKKHSIEKENKYIKEDLDCTIKFKTKFLTVTYDFDNGSGNGKNCESPTLVKYASKFRDICTDVTKKGYTFTGWKDGNRNIITKDTAITEDKKLKAQYTLNQYNITYNLNGGTNPNDAVNTYTVITDTFNLPTPSRTGYTFNGWYDNKDFSGSPITKIEKGSIDDRTYYAKWTANKYVITYDYNYLPNDIFESSYNITKFNGCCTSTGNGSLTSTSITYPTEGKLFTVKSKNQGWYFSAKEKLTVGKQYTWSFDAKASTDVKLNVGSEQGGNKTVEVSTSWKRYTNTFTASSTNYSAFVFYGWFGSDERTLEIRNLQLQEGSLNTKSYTLTYDTKLGSSVLTPTREGYTFTGWYTNSNGEAKITENTDVPASDTTYYAGWTLNKYKITYNLNGGTNPSSGVVNDYTVVTNTFDLPKPTRKGYTFNGWYNNSNFSGSSISKVDRGTIGNKTLYAKWTAKTYTVTLNQNGGTSDTNTITVTYDQHLPNVKVPTRTGYTFNGYYTSTSVIDMDYSVNTSSYTRIDLKKSSNNWKMTNEDKNTHINAVINVNDSKLTGAPSVQFNDVKLDTSMYKVEGSNGNYTYYLDFDITDNMVSKRGNYDYSTSYRFIDFEGNGINSNTVVTVKSLIKGGKKYYDSEGKSLLKYDQDNNISLYAGWTANKYTVTYNSGNLLYGLDNIGETTASKMKYSISNGVVTVTANSDDGYGYTNGRVYLEKDKTYIFNATSNGTWGGTSGSDTVEAFLMLDGSTQTAYYRMDSNNNFTFKPTYSGTYYLRLDVNQSGKTHTFSNISITTDLSTKEVTFDSTYNSLNTQTRSGYTFNGWYTSISGGTKVESTTTVKTASDHRIYAQYTPYTYKITYNLNGGKQGNSSPTEATYDKRVDISNPSKVGYTFSGWTFNGNTSIAKYGSKSSIDTLWSSTSTKVKNEYFRNLTNTNNATVTMTANYTANKYTVTFNANGGSVKTSSITVTYDSTYGDMPTATKTGYTFSGWYTSASGGTKIESTTKVTTASNHTLYAHYTINSYTLTINPNGGTYNNETSSLKIKQHYNSTYGLNKPTRTGYLFNSWALSGGGTLITGIASGKSSSQSGFTITDKTESDGSKYTKYTVTSSPTTDTWNFIRFPQYKFTIGHTYQIKAMIRVNKLDGGSLNIRHSCNTNDYNSTGKVIQYITSSEVGKEWIEYTLERKFDSTTETLTTGSSVTVNPLFEIYTSNLNGKSVNIDIDIKNVIIKDITSNTYVYDNDTIYQYGASDGTLNATYTPNKYTVTFNANGGSVTTASKVVTYDSTYGDMPTATKTGYTFIGWFTSSSKYDNKAYKDYPMYYYADKFEDLYNTFGYDEYKLYNHYLNHGKNENRRISEYISTDKVQITKNTTFYAGYTPNKYTITLNNQGTTTKVYYLFNTTKTINNVLCYYYKNTDLTTCLTEGYKIDVPKKTGYTFHGYYTEENGKGTQYVNSGGSFVNNIYKNVSEDKTLYAYWTADTHNVTYDINHSYGYSSNQYLDTGYKINWNNDFTITSKVKITSSGKRYLIFGNYKSEDNTTLNVEVNTDNQLRVFMGNNALDKKDGTFVFNEDVTVTYKWDSTNKKYSITAKGTKTNISFEGTMNMSGTSLNTLRIGTSDNRGSSVFSPITVSEFKITTKHAYDSVLSDVPTSSMDGYDFNGYYTSKTSGDKVTSSTVMKSTSDITYYAQWKDTTAPAIPTYEAKYVDGSGNYTSDDWTNKEVYTVLKTTDAGSGIYFEYSKDNQSTWTKLNLSHSNGIQKDGITYTGKEKWTLTNGRNDTVYFRACDSSGNCSKASEAFNIKYDTKAPSAPEIISMYDIYESRSQTLQQLTQNNSKYTSTGNDPFINYSNIDGITGITGAYVSLNSNLSETISMQVFYEISSNNFNETNSKTLSFASGTKRLYIPFTSGDWSKIRYDFGSKSGITFDIASLGVVAKSGQWNRDDISLRLSTTEEESGVDNWQFTFNSSATAVTTDPTASASKWVKFNSSNMNPYLSDAFTANRESTVYIRACDKVGNCSTASKADMKIDKTSPTATITKKDNKNVTLTYSDNFGVVGYYFGTTKPNSSTTYTSMTSSKSGTLEKTVTTSGTYYFSVKDAAGNIETVSTKIDHYTATFKYYNGQTATVSCNKFSSENNCTISSIGEKGTPSGYTFRGYSTSDSADATASKNTSITLTEDITYYASYEKTVEATFRYSTLANNNFTYVTPGATTTASAKQYINYKGDIKNSNIEVPSVVKNSIGGPAAENYKGVSTSVKSDTVVTPTTANTNYYAVYTEDLIFYYYNGSSHTSTSSVRKMLYDGSNFKTSLSITEPTPSAYNGVPYVGWTYVKDYVDARKPLETGVNALYAYYKKDITVSFTNVTTAISSKTSTVTYISQSGNIKRSATSITLPTPSKTGYTFNGWYYGETFVGNAGATYTPTSDSNMTLSAKWTANKYNITYDYNYLSNDTFKNSYNIDTFNACCNGSNGSLISTSITYPTEGKLFTVKSKNQGWYFSAKEKLTVGKQYTWSFEAKASSSASLSAGSEQGGTKTVEVGTSWKRYTYTFTAATSSYYAFEFYNWYDSNNEKTLEIRNLQIQEGTLNTVTNTLIYDNKLGNSISKLSRIGYNFTGWYTDPIGGDQVNANTSVPASDTTYYAHWTLDKYNITYNLNGGEFSGNVVNTYTVVTNTFDLPKPTRTGYDFEGWYDNKNLSGTSISKINRGTTGKKTLYAKWTPKQYTVTFDANGGTVADPTTRSVTYNSTYGELAKTTRTGYTFAGWFTEKTGGTKVESTTTVTTASAHTLYAHWNVNSGIQYKVEHYQQNITDNKYTLKETETLYGTADTKVTPDVKTYTGFISPSTQTKTINADGSTVVVYEYDRIEYIIRYDLNYGTEGSKAPTSATFDEPVNIDNPTKTVKVTLINNVAGATVDPKKESVSAAQTFAGWTASNLNTSTAKYGSSSNSVNTSWSSTSTKVKAKYFQNLQSEETTVTLTANWEQKNVSLPTITKTGYNCGWTVSSSEKTIQYKSGEEYVPKSIEDVNVTLYAVCEAIPPKLTFTLESTDGKKIVCSNGTCGGFTDKDETYVLPITLSTVVESEIGLNEDGIKLRWNVKDQTDDETISSPPETQKITDVDGKYTTVRSLTSGGNRVLEMTATDKDGNSTTVIIKAKVKGTFSSTYKCNYLTINATSYAWKANSTCTNFTTCGANSCSSLGVVGANKTVCALRKYETDGATFVIGWIPYSSFSEGYSARDSIDYCHDYYEKKLSSSYTEVETITYDNVTYYLGRFAVSCSGDCGIGDKNDPSQKWIIENGSENAIYNELGTIGNPFVTQSDIYGS